MFDPNASENKGGDYAPVSPGEKVAAVVRVARGVSRNGKPFFGLTWVVLHDRSASSGEHGDATKLLFDDVYINFRLGNLCRALGQTAPFDDTKDEVVAGVLTQAAVVLTVEHEEYNGKTRPKVARYAKFGGQWDPAWDDAIADGEGRAEKAAAARAAKMAGGGSATTVTTSSAATDDMADVPF